MVRQMKLALLIAGAAAVAAGGQHVAKRAVHAAKSVAHVASGPASPAGVTPIDPKSVPPMVLGMNVSILADWSREDFLNDPVWTHSELNLAHPGPNSQLQRDSRGWPIGVAKDTQLDISTGQSAHDFGPPLDCVISPGWRASGLSLNAVQNGTHVRFTGNGDLSGAHIALFPYRDNTDLKQLSCHRQGRPEGELFNPVFVAYMKPFRIIRFMNWMKANNNPPGKWANRPTSENYSAMVAGVPVEYMVQLANMNHSDAWFTLPWAADEDYQRRFATYVRDNLDRSLKVYAELSNEVWNGGFPQAKQASAEGARLYPTADATQQNDFAYADRVRRMMAIWSEVFADQKPRLVRVLGAQAGWSQKAENALGHKETWRSVDVVAVAPYWGEAPFDVQGTGPQRVNGIFAKLPAYIDTAIGWAKSNKQVANRYGLRLIAYEGGPSLTGYEPKLLDDIRTVYRDPRFVGVYNQFLDRWRKEVGGEFVAFDSAGDGLWGHLEYTAQKIDDAPRMKALVDYIAKYPPPAR
jgi:hypothetical protein